MKSINKNSKTDLIIAWCLIGYQILAYFANHKGSILETLAIKQILETGSLNSFAYFIGVNLVGIIGVICLIHYYSKNK